MDLNNQNRPEPEGEILLVDKPITWTSFDAVKKIKYSLKLNKAGHAGTLDPLASGLLIICTEKKTKLISSFQDMEKEYTGSFVIGEIRPSYDRETPITEKRPISGIEIQQILDLPLHFYGEINQVPPLFSAIKSEGQRAYTLARKGIDKELPPRKVTITRFEILNIQLPEIYFRLVCSKGFYVRSLVRDIGEYLRCGASLQSLRRTRIGHFTVQEAVTPQDLINARKK